MATVDPKPAVRAAVPAPKPPEPEVEMPEPQVESVNIAGLVLEKTIYPDGMCETEVLSEPEIDPALVRATRNLQRSRGH